MTDKFACFHAKLISTVASGYARRPRLAHNSVYRITWALSHPQRGSRVSSKRLAAAERRKTKEHTFLLLVLPLLVAYEGIKCTRAIGTRRSPWDSIRISDCFSRPRLRPYRVCALYVWIPLKVPPNRVQLRRTVIRVVECFYLLVSPDKIKCNFLLVMSYIWLRTIHHECAQV